MIVVVGSYMQNSSIFVVEDGIDFVEQTVEQLFCLLLVETLYGLEQLCL